MQLIHSNFFDLYEKILDKYRNGEGEGIRWILTVDKDNKEQQQDTPRCWSTNKTFKESNTNEIRC